MSEPKIPLGVGVGIPEPRDPSKMALIMYQPVLDRFLVFREATLEETHPLTAEDRAKIAEITGNPIAEITGGGATEHEVS